MKDNIIKQMELKENKWILDTNVQTFSYFVACSPNIISIMDDLFNGDFTYDYSGKKSCLKDTLKNYAYYYDRLSTESTKGELEHISEILIRKENKKIFY